MWVFLGEPALAAADPYRVLGVSPAASAAEIKAAYRALVKQHHPDAGGDHRTILELNAAWEVLRNSERRRGYDNLNAPGRQEGSAPSAGPAPFAGRGPVCTGTSGGAAGVIAGDYGFGALRQSRVRNTH